MNLEGKARIWKEKLVVWQEKLVVWKEKLVIISPHRKSIQREFVPLFEEMYSKKYKAKIDVEWIDQGGSENDLRFVINRYKDNPKTSGVDLFWGGGDVTFHDLEERKLLSKYRLPKELENSLPSKLGGLNLKSQNNFWFATAISSFGIFYNKRILKLLSLKEPKIWEDLSNKTYFDYISVL